MLTLETARDHLRSIALDWPRQLAHLDLATSEGHTSNQPLAAIFSALPAMDDEAMNWLKACPLTLTQPAHPLTEAKTQEALMLLRTWLQDRVLLQPLEDWLVQHRAPEALASWCRSRAADLPPARFLATCYAKASALSPQGFALGVLNLETSKQTTQLAELVAQIATLAGFAQFPTWNGQCQETGSWTRLRHHASTTGHPSPAATSAWTRLASRWMELIELVNMNTSPLPLPEGEGARPSASNASYLPPRPPAEGTSQNAAALPPLPLGEGRGEGVPAALSSGALHLGLGQAIAWCEMARGLLLHWVQLDSAGKVADYRIIAPTEWNFHPEGALARSLRPLQPDDTASAWVLAAAYDAYVQCSVAITSE